MYSGQGTAAVSFRRDCRNALAWKLWVTIHQAELIAIGIPREVWSDLLTWNRFLEHGYHPPIENARDIRFRLDDLSPSHQQRFFSFLANFITERERPGNNVWAVLQHRSGAEVNDQSM